MNTPVRILLWAALGAVLGTSLDAVHVVTGVLVYPHTPLGLQDWWVPLLFAVSGVALGEGHRQVARRISVDKLPRASKGEVLRGLGAFVVSYGSSGFLKAFPWAELALYVAMFAVCLVMTPLAARPALWLHAAGTAVTGPLVEAGISSTGAFHYLPEAGPLVLGVPIWLTGIYLCVALGTAALDRALPS
jgi:hypothetical protein